MRKTMIILFLICYSLAIANPVFNQEIADSLIFHLKDNLSSNESYYLVNSNLPKLDNYLLEHLNNLNIDIRMDKDTASKSLLYSINEDMSIVSKRTFLFSRQVRQSEFLAEAKIIDNSSSKIEKHIDFSKVEVSSIEDGNVTLWKSVIVSLLTGTLIYSLWSIE